MSVKEAVAFFKTTTTTIHRWANTGVLTKIHVVGRVYFDKAEVENLVNKNK